MIKIHGFNKVTLLDYPGKLACTIFLGHCNFRCPFCHNAGLVLHPEKEPVIPAEQVLATLKKRRGILEGVCITGGEPTLSPQLPEFIAQVKALGYQVKLDTNGTRPDLLKTLIEEQKIDYVAMDIKNAPEKYCETAGISPMDLSKIQESIELLMSNVIDYEFRTTVVKELHTEEDMRKIGQWLKGCKRYFLQNYRETEQVIHPVFSSYSKKEMEWFREILRETIPQVEIRGMD